MSIGYDNRPNLNNQRFEQRTGDTLNLCGYTCIMGTCGEINSDNGYRISGSTILSACGSSNPISLQLGLNASTIGSDSIAIGYNSQAIGNKSLAIGCGNVVCALNSSVIAGKNTTICSGNTNSVFIGFDTCTIPVDSYCNTLVVPSVAILTSPTGSGGYLCYNPTTKKIEQTTGGGGSSVSGENITKQITQASHGFAVKDVIGWSGGSYNKAIADGSYDGEVVGIVSKYIDTNTFDLTQAGYITGLTSLVANTTYFLSDGTAGLLTSTEPTAVGHVSKSVLVTNSTTTGWVLPYAGYIITSGSSGGSGITGATNGICKYDSANVCLGGALTGDVLLSGGSTGLLRICSEKTTCTSLTSFSCGGFSACACNPRTTWYSCLSNGGFTQLTAGNAGATQCNVMVFRPDAVYFTIGGTSSGPQYVADYCTKFNSNLRAIPDTGWVKSYVSSQSGTTITGTTSHIPVFNSVGDNIEDSTLTFASHVLNDTAEMSIKTTTGDIHLDARSDAVNGVVVLGDTDTPATAINRKICVEGLASNISMFVTPKGTGNLYLGLGYNTYLAGTGCSGWQFGTSGLLVGPKGARYSVYGGNTTTPDAEPFCIFGGAGFGQTGYNGDGGDLCLCGGGANGITVGKTGGDLVLKSGDGNPLGTAGRIIMCDLPAQSTETDVLYIDGSGNLSCGAGGGGSTPLGWSNLAGGTTIIGCGTNQTSGSTALCNTVYGSCAGAVWTTGFNNTAVGYKALANANNACNNTGVGACALQAISTGTHNTAIGSGTLQSNNTGCGNVALGYAAMILNTSGWHNIGIGYGSLQNNSNGNCNVSLGYRALQFIGASSNNNIGIGQETMSIHNTGCDNIGIGKCALLNNASGCDNIAIGCWVMRNNSTGINNIAIGKRALFSNTTASNNIGIGSNALTSNLTGANNIGIGEDALCVNNSGGRNVAVGACTLWVNISGNDNTAIGNQALHSNISNNNVAVGASALYANTSGYDNIGIGLQSLRYNLTGGLNVVIGENAMFCNTAGSTNTVIGNGAGFYLTGSGNVLLGYAAGLNCVAVSNKLHIANSASCSLICGDFAAKTICIDNCLYVNSVTCPSDCRLKSDISSISIAPVEVEYKQFNHCDSPDKLSVGLIAQELCITHPDLVSVNDKGYLGINYGELHSLEIAYLKCRVCELEEKINQLIEK